MLERREGRGQDVMQVSHLVLMRMAVPLEFIMVETLGKEQIQGKDTGVSTGHSESEPIGDKVIKLTFWVTVRERKASPGIWALPDSGPQALVFSGASLALSAGMGRCSPVRHKQPHRTPTSDKVICDCDEVTDPFIILSGH